MYSWCIDAVMSLSSERERPVLLEWWNVNCVIFNNANWCWLLYFMGKSSMAHKLRPEFILPCLHTSEFPHADINFEPSCHRCWITVGIFPETSSCEWHHGGSNLFYHLLSCSIIWPSNSITILNICILMSVEMYLKCLYKLTFFFLAVNKMSMVYLKERRVFFQK